MLAEGRFIEPRSQWDSGTTSVALWARLGLVLLGYAAERNDHAPFPGHRFLAKPFGRDDLIAAVATGLAEGETARS